MLNATSTLLAAMSLVFAHCAAQDGSTSINDAGNIVEGDGGSPSAPVAMNDGAAPPSTNPGNNIPPTNLPPTQGHRRCGWIFSNQSVPRAAYLAHAAYFDAIHPDWFALDSDGRGVRAINGQGDAQLISVARANNAKVIPMVASVDDVSYTRTMLYDAGNRAAHIQNLVDVAVQNGYDGLDLDYEHLWDNADHDPLATFIVEAAAAMHAAGKQLSMTAPALPDPNPVWDYAVLGANLDDVHIMAYDFHTIGTHAGPTTPLGWADAVAARAASLGHPEKFILGLPNYGVTPTTSCVLDACAASCSGPIATSTDHMLTCSLANAPYAAGRSLNCTTASGEMLYFDDTASLREKVEVAAKYGLAGIGYWNVGDEPQGFFDMVRNYY